MTYPGGRAVSLMESGDRRSRESRFSEGPWSIESASGGVRDYARHARSMSARKVRQRMLALALAGTVVATVAVVAGPRAVRVFTTGSGAAMQAAVATRDEAAAWIRRWVSHSAFVACDPVMCTVLHAHGMAFERLMPIKPDSADPVSSDIVVETAAVRNQFGQRLANVYAPEELAGFGSGQARIVVRVVSQARSVAEYRRELRANLSLRHLAGREFLHNRDIAESAAAARQLARGRVDLRILASLGMLAHEMPIAILRFAGGGPGASRGMPLLSVDITGGERPAGNSAVSAAYARVETPTSLRWIMAILRAQIAPLQPASYHERTSPGGISYVRIDYGAPTPLKTFSIAP